MEWGKCGPFAPTLSYGILPVVCGFLFIWYTLGYATVGYGFVNILGGQFWLES